MDKHNLELVIELRRKLHAEPELSGHETGTRRRLMDFLSEHTSLEVVDRGKWFYAIYHAGESCSNLAFRADMDAVAVNEQPGLPYASCNPGVSHKCGHDGHCATLAGFAMELDRLGTDRNVYFLFQHAEENGEGAQECASLIEECGINGIFGLHNMPGLPKAHVALREGTLMCASEGITVSLTGTSTHASTPEKGINPAQALAELILEIPKLSETSLYQSSVMCTVIHAELGTSGAFGVSASKGSLSVTCRAWHDEDLEALKRRLRECAWGKAKKYGLGCGFSSHDCFPATINHHVGAEHVRDSARHLGLSLIELNEPLRGSEDFGHYLNRIPGAFFFLGAGDCPSLHSWDYDYPDDLIETGVELFKALVPFNVR